MSEKKYGFIVKCAVLSLIVLEYTTSIASPALGKMAEVFLSQGVSPELIKQVQSLPNLTMIIVALLLGQFERFISKRTMIIIASILIFVGGIAPVFGGGIYFILACRALLGLGRGFAFPLALSYIPDLFEGQERDSLMGIQGGVGAISGIIYMTLAAMLTAASWRNAFWLYLVVIPIFLLVLFKLPEPEKRPAPVTADGTAKSRLTGSTWAIIIVNAVAMFAIYSFITNMAIVLQFTKIGGPAQAANILSTFTIGAFVAGIIFGKVRLALKKYTQAVSVIFLGAGFTIILLASSSLSMYYFAAIIFGLGFGTYNPDIFLKVADSADKSAAALSLSLFMAFNAIGQFGSNIVLYYIANILGIQGPMAGWLISGPALLVGGIVLIVLNSIAKPKTIAAEVAK